MTLLTLETNFALAHDDGDNKEQQTPTYARAKLYIANPPITANAAISVNVVSVNRRIPIPRAMPLG